MRVLLLHRCEVIAEGLRLLVETNGDECLTESWAGDDANLERLRMHGADVILVDPDVPGVNIEMITRFVAPSGRPTPVAVISTDVAATHLVRAVGASAQGYISLNTNPSEFIASIRMLAKGHIVVTGPEIEALGDVAGADNFADHVRPANLTQREREVAVLVAEGLTNRELASRLFLSEGTVKVHIRNIFRKLGMSHRVELASHAFRSGMIA